MRNTKKTIIILGSSRSNGKTAALARKMEMEYNFELVDLNELDFSAYDYKHLNREDEFLPLMRRIVESYSTIIFATPIYWYSMSGIMKNFFDRISDCIQIEKETGRKLRGMNMAMISCSDRDDRVKGFEMPFRESASYLGMNYLGDFHGWIQEDGTISEPVQNHMKKLIAKIPMD